MNGNSTFDEWQRIMDGFDAKPPSPPKQPPPAPSPEPAPTNSKRKKAEPKIKTDKISPKKKEPPKKVATVKTRQPSKKKPAVPPPEPEPEPETAGEQSADENDSDTSEEEENEVEKLRFYREQVDKSLLGPAMSAARAMKIPMDAMYSDVLDSTLTGVKVSAKDFEFGRDENENLVAPPTTTVSVVRGDDECNTPRVKIREEMTVVAEETMNALNVNDGETDRRLAERAVEEFQNRKGRLADTTDTKDIRREMRKIKAADDKKSQSHKWSTTCDDKKLVEIAGTEAEEAKVRNRVNARSVEDLQRRNAVAHIVDETRPPALEVARESSLFEEQVDAAEIRLSGTGCATSAHATTPAPGTKQSEHILEDLKKLADRNVAVSEPTRIAKMATSVPPSVPVNGRRVDEMASLDSMIMGNGSTIQTPLDFALEPLIKKSQTGENLIHTAIEELYLLLARSVKTFSAAYETAPHDSSFRTDHVAYTKLYSHRVHQAIADMFPLESDPVSMERRADLRKYFADTFADSPDSERKERLLEQLKKTTAASSGGAGGDGAGIMYNREALVDSVLLGAESIASSEKDVHAAAQRCAMQWQIDAEVEAYHAQIPDITNDEIAEQMSYTIDASRHVLLQSLRRHHTNDVLFENNQAPITLRRETETIFGNGTERNVVTEATRLIQEMQGDMDFLRISRQEMTRDLRRAQARLDDLIELAKKQILTQQEIAETEKLRGIISAAKVASKSKECEEYVKQLGHIDAAATVLSLLKTAEMKLEVVSRAYIAEFLREPMGAEFDERPCANDYACICAFLATSLRYVYECDRTKGGFVCREFLLPSQLLDCQRRGSVALPQHRQFCYLCHVYQTTHQFFMRADSQSGGERLVVLQKFQTIFDKPGEYSSDRCNLAAVMNHRAYGIIAPFPMFDARNYTYGLCAVKAPNGEKYKLRQMIETTDILFH